jgi:hypothetical protein
MATKKDLRKLPKDKRPKPTTGQSAASRELSYEDLSEDEAEVVKALDGRAGAGKRHVRPIAFLAELFGGDDPKLQTRNALRRPVSCGWVDNVGRGAYQISEKGRKRLARA